MAVTGSSPEAVEWQWGCFGGFSELLDPAPVALAAVKDGDHLAAPTQLLSLLDTCPSALPMLLQNHDHGRGVGAWED